MLIRAMGTAFQRAALTLLCFAVLVQPAIAATPRGVVVYGPLMCALEIAYREWVGTYGVPRPEAFSATLDATRDPYLVTFVATPGHHASGTTYSIDQSRVLDTSFGMNPAWAIPISKGPVTLSGSYVTAFDAAYQYRIKSPPVRPWSYINSDASFVAIAVLSWYHGAYRVSMQQLLPAEIGKVIGCDIEQDFDIDPASFAVMALTWCLP
jgi:hypothetical protein